MLNNQNQNDFGSIQLKCPKCFESFVPTDINAALALAQCPCCHSTFRFANQLKNSDGNYDALCPVDLPKASNVEVQNQGDRPLIKRSWKSPFSSSWIGMAIALNLGLAAFYCITINANAPALVFFPLPVQIIGLIVLYVALTHVVNSTVIQLQDKVLTITHGPLPWSPTKELDISEVCQFFVLRTYAQGNNGRLYYKHSIYAKLESGSTILVLKDLSDAWQALYIEQEIENFLGIANLTIEGEINRQDILVGVI